jgi:hypothetical protein
MASGPGSQRKKPWPEWQRRFLICRIAGFQPADAGKSRRPRIENPRYGAARASRNQSIISETGKLRTGKFFGKSLLRSHKKSSREGTISSDTDRVQLCATVGASRGAPSLVLPAIFLAKLGA